MTRDGSTNEKAVIAECGGMGSAQPSHVPPYASSKNLLGTVAKKHGDPARDSKKDAQS